MTNITRRDVLWGATAVADAWRALYQPSMEEVRSGRQPFVKLDILHRRMLDQIKPKFGLEKLDDKVADDLNLAWHRIDTWPDVVPGFVRLQRKFMLAPCSNGNIALMVDIARRNKFSWDAVLGSEIARDFKPKPAVYLMTAAALLRPCTDCLSNRRTSGAAYRIVPFLSPMIQTHRGTRASCGRTP